MNIIDIYQRYISRFIAPNKCRYFPSCSEYAKELYRFDNPLKATLKTLARVLSCNQLFPGGISYPQITIKPTKINTIIINPKYFTYWFVPTSSTSNYVYIIKNYDKAKRC